MQTRQPQNWLTSRNCQILLRSLQNMTECWENNNHLHQSQRDWEFHGNQWEAKTGKHGRMPAHLAEAMENICVNLQGGITHPLRGKFNLQTVLLSWDNLVTQYLNMN